MQIIEDRKIARLRLVTLAHHTPHINGGGYIAYTYLTIGDNSAAIVTYGISMDIPFCKIKGEFTDCSQCYSRAPRTGLCREQPRELSAAEVKAMLEAAAMPEPETDIGEEDELESEIMKFLVGVGGVDKGDLLVASDRTVIRATGARAEPKGVVN